MNNETPSSRRVTSKLSPSSRLIPRLAWLGLVILAFIVVTPFLVPLAWASILCYASWPVVMRVRQYCKGRDTLAASISTLLAAITLFLPLIWLVWLAQKERQKFTPRYKLFLQRLYRCQMA